LHRPVTGVEDDQPLSLVRGSVSVQRQRALGNA